MLTTNRHVAFAPKKYSTIQMYKGFRKSKSIGITGSLRSLMCIQLKSLGPGACPKNVVGHKF